MLCVNLFFFQKTSGTNNTLWTSSSRMAKEINQLTGRRRGCNRCSSSWRGHDINIDTKTMTWHWGIVGVFRTRWPPSPLRGVGGVTVLGVMGVLGSIAVVIAQRGWGRYMFCSVVISTVFILSWAPRRGGWYPYPHLRGVLMWGYIHV